MEFPNDRRYTKEHEWALYEDGIVTVGITDYAQDQLGDIVFIELPAADEAAVANDTFGSVESVKAVSDIFSPVSGIIKESNGALEDAPELVNEDPYEAGWMIKIEVSGKDDFDALMDVGEYSTYVDEEIEKAALQEELEELDDGDDDL